MPYLGPFFQMPHTHIDRKIDYAVQCLNFAKTAGDGGRHSVIFSCHEQSYCAEAHLFQRCEEEGSLQCLRTVWSAHTSQANLTESKVFVHSTDGPV